MKDLKEKESAIAVGSMGVLLSDVGLKDATSGAWMYSFLLSPRGAGCFMNPHRIRLAGPWEWCDSSAQSTGVRQSCQLPFSRSATSDGEPSSDCGSLLLSRRFHCPTGIDSTTVVKIALEVHAGNAEAKLNGTPLEAEFEADHFQQNAESSRVVRFPVSGALKSFNELQVVLSHASDGLEATLISAHLEIHQ